MSRSDPVTVVGVDCATVPNKVGLARASFAEGIAELQEVRCGAPGLTGIIADWVRGAPRALIALDAPLGWPQDFGAALAAHAAGEPLPDGPLFNRRTDRFVRELLGQRPLEVGADRIGRTARATLRLLQDLRAEISAAIPLVWDSEFDGCGAIEVYPAATLRAHGLPSRSYKKSVQSSRRREIYEGVGELVDFSGLPELFEPNPDELDAIVCVLAAQDFLQGNAIAPEDMESARKEGWIWVRGSSSHG